MAKRGRPKKVQKVDETIAKIVGQVDVEPLKKGREPESISPANTDDSLDFGGESRQNTYDEFSKHAGYDKDNFSDTMSTEEATGLKMDMGDVNPTDDLNTINTGQTTEKSETDTTETTAETVEEKTKTEIETETIETDTTEATAEKVETKEPETKPEEETTELKPDKVEVPKDKDTELVKTVPYGALHEEREKRKTLQKQVDELMTDNRKFMNKLDESSKTSEEYVGEVDEIQVVQKENANLKSRLNTIENRFQQDDVRREQDQFDKLVVNADKKLSEKGFTGFKDVGLTWVDKRIREIETQDPDLAQAYRNPDGWVKLWSEQGFHEVQKIFMEQHKATTLSNKRKLKENVNLVTSHGKVIQPEQKKETPYGNFEDYKKEREKFLL